MNFSQVIIFLVAVVANAQPPLNALAQNNAPAVENSSNNSPAVGNNYVAPALENNSNSSPAPIDTNNYGDGQMVDNRKNQYQEMKSYANANGYAANNLPQSMQDNMAVRSASIQQFRASVSSLAVARGYSEGFSAIPASVRQQFMSSVMIAKSADFSQMRESASAFMATQTRINTESLAQLMATAPVKHKKKGFFQFKKKKAAATKPEAASGITPSTTGLSEGFKNFFKSIQMKIQKSSSVASAVSDAPAPTASAVSDAPAPTAST